MTDRRRVRGWARDLAMGARFAFSGRQGRVRTALTALGVALGVAMLLLAASVPHALSERDARTDARGGLLVDAGVEHSSDRSLLVADANTSYHDKELHARMLQAEGSHPVTPPGVDRFPRPGEMVVSPALKELLASQDGAELTKRFDHRVVGTIGKEGLSGPAELSAYLGTDELTPGATGVRLERFGISQDRPPMDPVLLMLGAVACVVLLTPVAVFVATATRFGGERRDRRLAALRLVGADAAMTRRIAAGESLAGAVLGVVLGAVLFALGRQGADEVSLFDASAFPSDVVPDPALGALVVLGVPAVAVAVSVFALRGVTIEPLGVLRESRPVSRRLWWRLVPPAVGLLLLLPLAGALRGDSGQVSETRVVSGALLLLSGVALLLPWLVGRLVNGLRGGTLSWQLAVRRLQLGGGTAVRAVSGITIAVAGAIALQMLFAGAEELSTRPTGQERTDARRITVGGGYRLSPAEAEQRTRKLRNIEGVASVSGYLEASQPIAGMTEAEQKYATVIVGDCARLRGLAALPSCHDGQVFRATAPERKGSGPPPRAGTALEVTGPGGKGATKWTVPASARTVRAKHPGWSDLPVEALLVTPSAAPVERFDVSYTGWIQLREDDPDVVEKVRTALYRDDPVAGIMQMHETETSKDFLALRRAVFAAATGVLALIGASMILSQIEQLRERRRQLAVLVAFGTRRRTLGASVLWQTAVPVALGLLLASGIGLGLGWALMRVIGRPVREWTVFWPMAGVGAGVIAVVTLLSMPVLWRLMRPDGLRTE
ncbi:ABC transporter permease [Streptomyces albus subsp. chlorinus]|uniref:ABC transporter permease n=1 Tax=Streptomyces albus TaxID=1888 RepID=UPI00156FA417|nr:ABC transporter permease [Streptomyces albus]NSC23645.1 ABC transporter permease [Streptomyces albus subsp. chlorinus]